MNSINLTTLFKILKYILNGAGIFWMVYKVYISFRQIVEVPSCNEASLLISENLKSFFPEALIVLGFMAGMNLFIERKVEKQRSSKEYMVIFFVQVVIVAIAYTLISSSYYNLWCVNTN